MLGIVIFSVLSFGLYPDFSHGLEGFDPTCQNHFTQGYGYRLFFNLPSSSFLKDGVVQFNFSLSGPSNGHVLLAETPNFYPAYEVVIGAGMNEFSEIRKYVSSKFEVKTSRITRKIMSPDEIRNFSITVNQSVIAVSTNRSYLIADSSYSRNTSWITFLSWRDPVPLDVKYLSFCAWTGITVNWYYDCKGATVVPEKVSTLRKLKSKLLQNYDPYSIPVQDDNKLMIDTSIDLHYINLDAKKSLLTTHGRFNFTWHDYRIKWNPKEYDNITSINLLHREIWLPEFTLFNSFDAISNPMSKSVTRITHNGLVSWWPNAETVTWCNLDLKNWPFDKQYCNVSLGLYSHPESIHISLSNLKPEISLKHLEWEIISVTGETTTTVLSWELNETEYRTESHKAFMLSIELKRQTQMHVYSFSIPIIASIIFIIGSFWLPVFSAKRLFLHSTCLILLLINLLSLDKALPALPNSTPHIISVNSSILFLASFHVIFAALMIGNANSFISSPPKFVTIIVNNTIMQTVFCIFGDYQVVEEETFIASDDDKIKSTLTSPSVLFGTVIDRLVFTLSMLYIFVTFIL